MSHPTWVRGLKHLHLVKVGNIRHVAPYVGAWIETHKNTQKHDPPRSHPTWVRGLKLIIKMVIYVDACVAPYVGAWIETYT